MILIEEPMTDVSHFQVQGTSMLPHLQEGDWILKESISSRFFPETMPLRVGDVVVFKSPWNKESQNVKRVIALARVHLP